MFQHELLEFSHFQMYPLMDAGKMRETEPYHPQPTIG